MQKIPSQNLKNKKETVGRVRDYEIGQYGVGGTTAVTLNTHNGNIMAKSISINKINKITSVITVNVKVSGRAADRTSVTFRLEKVHKSTET